MPDITIPRSGTTYDVSPQITVTVSAVIPEGASVKVLRNGEVIGTALPTAAPLTYVFTDAFVPIGTNTYSSRIERGSEVRISTSNYPIVVAALPNATITVFATTSPIDVEVNLVSSRALYDLNIPDSNDADIAYVITIKNNSTQDTAFDWPVTWTPPPTFVRKFSTNAVLQNELPDIITLTPLETRIYVVWGAQAATGLATVSVLPGVDQTDTLLSNNTKTVTGVVHVSSISITCPVSDVDSGVFTTTLYINPTEPSGLYKLVNVGTLGLGTGVIDLTLVIGTACIAHVSGTASTRTFYSDILTSFSAAHIGERWQLQRVSDSQPITNAATVIQCN
jgi:hypothetical protein